MLHQPGFDPVVVLLLQDPIGDGGGIGRDLKAVAEGLAETLPQGSGQPTDGGLQLLDDGRLEGPLTQGSL